MALRLRPAFRGPSDQYDSKQISFHHPGYDSGFDLLIALFAFDNEGGLYHGFALEVLTIIAANAQGCLSNEKHGPAISTPRSGLLTESDYWFIVPRRHVPGRGLQLIP